MSPKDVAARLGVSPDRGLGIDEVGRRREAVGPNVLAESSRRSPWATFADQFRSVVVLLLAAAMAVSFGFGEIVEGIAIAVVLLLNTAVGFVSEIRAVRSMEALRKMAMVPARVRRAGRSEQVSATELVPGDVVLLDAGDVVSADLRIVDASRLQANESTLTGESAPVAKGTDSVSEDAPLAEQPSMLFKGTTITRGSAVGVTVATGMDTELGRITSLVAAAGRDVTPLQERLDSLGRRLLGVTLVVAAVVVVMGIVRGRGLFITIETAIALAVAAIPEGLPIVATLALARGMLRMADRNALVERLSAVETLGSTTVILTDKTGTLTENRMTLRRFVLSTGEVEVDGSIEVETGSLLHRATLVSVLCNESSLGDDETDAVGDPMEVALLRAARKAGFEREAMLEEYPEMRRESFDPDVKMMATFNRDGEGILVSVKGAPEEVLGVCTHVATGNGSDPMSDTDREWWLSRGGELGREGLRLLGLAFKSVEEEGVEPYEDLTFIGLAGLLDPPREEVAGAIRLCLEAGINIVMVTGDQAQTAEAIAEAVGLVEADESTVAQGHELRSPDELQPDERERLRRAKIFARTSPEQKLHLLALHQEGGQVVAMLGDGVNDAPALRKADIGVAMGQRGTEAAKEASDMVLRDDRFETIVAAVEQGRTIFENIRKFVVFLLSCNLSEILVIGLASVTTLPLPILPLQILFLNLVTDVFPALALGVGESPGRVMDRPPRSPSEPVLTSHHWWRIGGYGTLITVSVLAVFVLVLEISGFDASQAVSIAFLTLAFAQLWHVLNMADPESGILRNEVTRNPWVWGALALCTVLLLAAVYVPGFSDVLAVEDPGRTGWLLVAGGSLVPLVGGRLVATVRRAESAQAD